MKERFEKYNSIENSYREAEVNKIINSVNPNEEWIVTEKIHGSNLSFITDGEEIHAAKRTSIISKEENFYNANEMFDKYSEKVKNIFITLQEDYDNENAYIQLYGEHFGGHYNGKSDKGYKKIQQEVQYIPFTDFIVFDCKITFKNGNRLYLRWDPLKELVSKNGIKHVPERFRGSFDDCCAFKNDYNTVVPALYGLEPMEDNVCEGNVIKTINEVTIGKMDERAILKNKNEKFKEKGKIKKIKKSSVLSDEEKRWIDEISKYYEKSRFDGLFSKGEVQKNWKSFGRIQGLFFQDVMDDFTKDNPKFLELDKKIRKNIAKLAQNDCSTFIRDILKKEV